MITTFWMHHTSSSMLMKQTCPPGQRVAVKGSKHVRVCNAGLKARFTVLACASAGGFVMPPFVIYQRKNLAESLVQGEIPGTMYGMNPNSGWIDGELFQEWFTRHFLKYAPATRPLKLSCSY